MMRSPWPPATRLAAGAFAVALAVFAWSMIDAVRVPPLPSDPVTAPAATVTLAGASQRAPIDVESAVGRDIFSPDRTAPSTPYRMPGERASADSTSAAPRPVLLGTAVSGDGRSFATVQLGAASPTLVHVGDTVGSWVVRAIERGKIVLTSATGERASIAVPKPGT